MASKFKLVLLLLLVVISAPKAYAGFFDFLFGGNESGSIQGKEDLSECGKAVDDFRKTQVIAKYCKKDDDCITMQGFCPLGCHIYINKTFDKVIAKKMDSVGEMCSNSVCSTKCGNDKPLPVCSNGKCQAQVD